MPLVEKACPVVVRTQGRRSEILAFVHPLAGKQFIKGSIETGEDPGTAAARELREESGLAALSPLKSLGAHLLGNDRQRWYFFSYASSGLPETWQHRTEDDFGHIFTFFWHPVDDSLDQAWHPIFHEAFGFFAPLIATQGLPSP